MMIEYAAQQASIEKLDLRALIGSLHDYHDARGVLNTNRRDPTSPTLVTGAGNTAAFVKEMAIKLNAGACMKTRDSNAVVTARFDPTNTDNWSFPTFMSQLQRNLSEGRPTGIAVHILGRRKASGSLTPLSGHEMLVVGFDAKTEIIYVNDTWSSVPSVWTRVRLHAWDRYFSYARNVGQKILQGVKSNWNVAFIRSGDMMIDGVEFTEVLAVLADPIGPWIDLNAGNGFVTTRLEFTPCDAAKEETTAPSRTKDLLTAYFKKNRGAPDIKSQGGVFSIELIDQDGLFSYYESKPTSEPEVWDAIFLDLCTVESPSDPMFASQCKAHLPNLLRAYPTVCRPPISLQDRPKCVFDQLARQNNLRVGGGRYDEGFRCLIWRNADEAFDSEKNCKPYD